VTSPPPTPTAALPPATLAYLFADHFVPPAPPGTKGHRSWASGAVVPTTDLAVTLGVIAVWGLRETGIPWMTLSDHSHAAGRSVPPGVVRNRAGSLTEWVPLCTQRVNPAGSRRANSSSNADRVSIR